ncbi:MAG: galactokinase [Ferruginibacter sp.]
MNNIAAAVLSEFEKRFNRQPNIYYSPGRINLIGEHIDYNSGYVMPAAIDKGIYYAVAPNNTSTIQFYALDFNESFSVELAAVQKNDGWRNYVLSVVNEYNIAGLSLKGFDCVFGGDIPVGSGMSSSAAVEGGLAYALNDIFELGLNRKELALLCQRAEHNYPGVKCGIMDMYASLNGKKDAVILLDCDAVTHRYFPFSQQDYKIVLINSKVHHSLASGEYNVRRRYCEEGLAVLKQEPGVQTFRDIKDVSLVEKYRPQMSDDVFNCCKYVVEEIGRTQVGGALLQHNDLHGFGKLMYQTHEGLSKLYKVSCEELDFLVEAAAEKKDIIGARLMGGGFGGCTINIIKKESAAETAASISQSYQNRFNILPEVYFVQICDGTNLIFPSFVE